MKKTLPDLLAEIAFFGGLLMTLWVVSKHHSILFYIYFFIMLLGLAYLLKTRRTT